MSLSLCDDCYRNGEKKAPGCEACARTEAALLSASAFPWGPRVALPEDDAIKAAFPTRSGRHDLYGEAMRLVSARHSKADLIALVNWLLHRIDEKNGEKK